MTVTISIVNDKDRSIVDTYDCDWCNASADGCKHCENGKIKFYSSRWQLNMANGNFSTLMSALGVKLSNDLCGSADARLLLAALDRFNPELGVRAERVDRHMVHCGIDLDYVMRRTTKLREIAMEAARREERIVWS